MKFEKEGEETSATKCGLHGDQYLYSYQSYHYIIFILNEGLGGGKAKLEGEEKTTNSN